MTYGLDILRIDAEREVDRLARFIVDETAALRRSGVIVGLSGGIDSAVMAALAVFALGPEKVVGLILPERESNPVSSEFAARHAQAMGIEHHVRDITATVDSVRPYAARDAYLQSLVPEYLPGCAYNISLPTDLLEREAFSIYMLQVRLPDGTIRKKRLGMEAFRTITAFANIKIRARMLNLYAEADRRSLVVGGTTNRTEYLLGDFCRYGDGGTDIEPLAHLYKNQVYQIAHHLGVTREIIERVPSPDTFSLPVSDQEFFFRIPFERLDHLLYAWEHRIPASETAAALGLGEDAVQRAFQDFTTKHRATAHLRQLPRDLQRP